MRKPLLLIFFLLLFSGKIYADTYYCTQKVNVEVTSDPIVEGRFASKNKLDKEIHKLEISFDKDELIFVPLIEIRKKEFNLEKFEYDIEHKYKWRDTEYKKRPVWITATSRMNDEVIHTTIAIYKNTNAPFATLNQSEILSHKTFVKIYQCTKEEKY